MKNASTTYIVLRGEEGFPPATLTPSQIALEPYADALASFWWALWITTLVIVVTHNVFVPLFYRRDRLK